MTYQDNISALILAGGQASRFNFLDKGLLEWQGTPLVAHVIKQLAPQVGHIMISCNRNLAQYQDFGYPCYSDTLSNFQGPLAGIQRGLEACETRYCLVCPCDMPTLPKDLSERLYQSLISNKADVSYVLDGERKQYLLALIDCQTAESLKNYLASGKRSVWQWYDTLTCQQVDFSDYPAPFHNLNTPESLKG